MIAEELLCLVKSDSTFTHDVVSIYTVSETWSVDDQ